MRFVRWGKLEEEQVSRRKKEFYFAIVKSEMPISHLASLHVIYKESHTSAQLISVE